MANKNCSDYRRTSSFRWRSWLGFNNCPTTLRPKSYILLPVYRRLTERTFLRCALARSSSFRASAFRHSSFLDFSLHFPRTLPFSSCFLHFFSLLVLFPCFSFFFFAFFSFRHLFFRNSQRRTCLYLPRPPVPPHVIAVARLPKFIRTRAWDFSTPIHPKITQYCAPSIFPPIFFSFNLLYRFAWELLRVQRKGNFGLCSQQYLYQYRIKLLKTSRDDRNNWSIKKKKLKIDESLFFLFNKSKIRFLFGMECKFQNKQNQIFRNYFVKPEFFFGLCRKTKFSEETWRKREKLVDEKKKTKNWSHCIFLLNELKIRKSFGTKWKFQNNQNQMFLSFFVNSEFFLRFCRKAKFLKKKNWTMKKKTHCWFIGVFIERI